MVCNANLTYLTPARNKAELQNLLKLTDANPDLPILICVSEFCFDDWYAWLPAALGACSIEDIIDAGERVFVKSDNPYIDDIVPACVGWDAYEEMTDDEAREAYEALPWQKVIAVRIWEI